jgi:hypothetical protein
VSSYLTTYLADSAVFWVKGITSFVNRLIGLFPPIGGTRRPALSFKIEKAKAGFNQYH